MYTLFDFITHVKGIEYIIAVLFIGVFLLCWEFLKARPFQKMFETGKEDLDYVKQGGLGNFMRSVRKLVSAPFIGLAYVLFIPVGFVAALFSVAIKGIAGLAGSSVSFGWRPSEAYLGGKKQGKKKTAAKDADTEKE